MSGTGTSHTDLRMTRRSFLTAGAAGTAALSAAAGRDAEAQRQRRNIIFILVDDLRFDAMSFMGHPVIESPNIDRLAENGLHMANAFVTTSLCSPSRASILTGLYAHQHQILDNSTLLDPAIPTFPSMLQRAGYRTGFVGKWHMGGSTDRPRPGFDRWVSFPGQGNYFNQTFNVDGEKVPREGYITDHITGYAEEFIRENSDRPFMLYMSHKATHAMFKPAPRHEGKYRDVTVPKPVSFAGTPENYEGKPLWVKRQRSTWHGVDGMYNHEVDFDEFYRNYCETVLGVDDSVGRIMQTLEDEGLADDTLVIFMGDNGFLFGEHGLIDKRCMYEPSIRVPMIVHCPALVRGSGRREELVLNIDIAPTILDAAGVNAPSGMHGRSFLPLIQNRPVDWRTEFLYEYFWERAYAQTPTVLGLRSDRYSFMRHHGVWDLYELYDIQADPDQMNNLLGGVKFTANHSDILTWIDDPDLKALVDDLQARLFRIVEDTGGRIEPTWKDSRG